MRHALSLLLGLAAALAVAPALGQQREAVRLEYAGAPTCISAESFRHLVAARMRGHDPFTAEAPYRIIVKLHRRGPAYFVGTVAEVDDATGEGDPPRELHAADCTEMVESLAGVIKLWLTPIVRRQPPASKPPEVAVPVAVPPVPKPPEPPTPQELPPPDPVPVAKPPPRRLPRDVAGLYVGGDVLFNPILAPIGSAGASLWVALRLRQPAMSIELGLRGLGSLGAAQTLAPAQRIYVPYHWTYVSGVVAATAHRGPVFFGPVFEVGRLTSGTDASSSGLQTSQPHVLGAGIHAGVVVPVADGIVVRSMIEGQWLPVGPFVNVSSSEILRTGPSFSSMVAIGLAFQLWSPGEGSR